MPWKKGATLPPPARAARALAAVPVPPEGEVSGVGFRGGILSLPVVRVARAATVALTRVTEFFVRAFAPPHAPVLPGAEVIAGPDGLK